MKTNRIGKGTRSTVRDLEKAGAVTGSRRFDETLPARKQPASAARGEELGRAFVERFGPEDLEMIASALAEMLAAVATREAFIVVIRRKLMTPSACLARCQSGKIANCSRLATEASASR